jgi:hypothetical protein
MFLMRVIVTTAVALAVPIGSVCGQDQTAPLPGVLLPEPAPPTEHPPPALPVEPPPPAPVREAIATGLGDLGADGFGRGGIGGGGFGAAGFGGLMGGSFFGPGYSANWYPARPVSGQPTDLGLVRQALNVGLPLWRDGGDLLRLTASVRNTMFFTDAVLPDTHRPFPGDLWAVNFGLAYSHRFDNGWTAGLMTSLGSASDKPFDGIREMSVGLSAFLRIPVRDERDAWLFSITYSPLANLNFPIPGVAYVWNPTDDLRVQVGLPFSVLWRPIQDLTIDMFYFPLTNVSGHVTYRLARGLRLYGGYEFLNESYFLADRAETRDRFMGFEQRVITGVRWDLWQHATLDAHGGYAFGRYFGEGVNQGSSLQDKVNIAPGAFIGASVRVRF